MSTLEQLALLCDRLASTKKRLEHAALIGTYLKSLPDDEIDIAARLIIGQVFPEGDPRILNLSGAAIERALAQTIDGDSIFAGIDNAVDFGGAVEKALSRRKHKRSGAPLTLAEVYSAYVAMADISGQGSREQKDARLRELFARASPLESKYIVKHLVKEMRVGVNEGSLLDAIARTTGVPAELVRRAQQFAGDIGAVARAALVSGESGVRQFKPRVGRPLKPMLAQSAADVAEAFGKISGGQIALEYKLDGARVQIHKRDEEIKIFSRHLTELTDSLPEIVEEARREIRAHDAIVEGEVIALTSDGRPRPFQELMRRVGRERDVLETAKGIPIRAYLFDCLYRDGDLLMDQPNAARWESLGAICGAIARVDRLIPRDVAEGQAFLARARSAGHEGLMAKDLGSPYTPGERGRQWLKIKPVITLDLVIVAADWGYGRRTGWLSNVHLAARDEESGELLEVGKTFKGLDDAELKWLTERLLSLKIRETRGTVFVQPRVVVEVAFNNVQSSPRYKSRVALRFARLLSFREDKTVGEIDTVQTLRGFLQ